MTQPPEITAIITDLDRLKSIYAEFLGDLKKKDWARQTGPDLTDWTIHQTLAHLVSVARNFNAALTAAALRQPLNFPMPKRREDLATFNAEQIQMLTKRTPDQLSASLLSEFDRAAQIASTLPPDGASRRVELKAYNRPAPTIHLLDWHLSHAGVVHAAQITRPLDGVPPLWTKTPPDMTWRQVTRFLAQVSWVYWPQYDDGETRAMNFHVGGDVADTWHLVAAPDGGSTGLGALDGAAYNLRFADADTLFAVFTGETRMKDALTMDILRVDEGWKGAFKLLKLFSTTPPT